MPSDSDSNGSPPPRADARVEDEQSAAVSPSPVPSGKRGPVKTTRERAEEKRQAKLDLVRQQLESGSLVIRRMTEAERRQYPPRPADQKQPKRR